ncbi:MAG: LytTR family DNA-binding domain-containing protein [Bacteroidales bacterium]
MDRVIIIDDAGIKERLNKFLNENKNNIRIDTDLEELSMGENTVIKELLAKYEEKYKIKIQSKDTLQLIPANDIVHIEIQDQHQFLYLSNNSTIEAKEPLLKFEKQLNRFPFLKTSPGFIININHITSISQTDENYIVMKTGEKIPVTKDKKRLIVHFIEKHLG